MRTVRVALIYNLHLHVCTLVLVHLISQFLPLFALSKSWSLLLHLVKCLPTWVYINFTFLFTVRGSFRTIYSFLSLHFQNRERRGCTWIEIDTLFWTFCLWYALVMSYHENLQENRKILVSFTLGTIYLNPLNSLFSLINYIDTPCFRRTNSTHFSFEN